MIVEIGHISTSLVAPHPASFIQMTPRQDVSHSLLTTDVFRQRIEAGGIVERESDRVGEEGKESKLEGPHAGPVFLSSIAMRIRKPLMCTMSYSRGIVIS